MDLNLAKTFLEVVESGNFHAASECLHVTQSTVSMRIKSLEEELGRKLFGRHRSGAALTAAGTQFRLSGIQIVFIPICSANTAWSTMSAYMRSAGQAMSRQWQGR